MVLEEQLMTMSLKSVVVNVATVVERARDTQYISNNI